MLDAAQAARSFAVGRSRADLDADLMFLMAVVRAVEIIGEAAINVSSETRDLLPELPWANIIGMRHRVIHAYFDVNRDIVWATLQEDLDPLVRALVGFLEKA